MRIRALSFLAGFLIFGAIMLTLIALFGTKPAKASDLDLKQPMVWRDTFRVNEKTCVVAYTREALSLQCF